MRSLSPGDVGVPLHNVVDGDGPGDARGILLAPRRPVRVVPPDRLRNDPRPKGVVGFACHERIAHHVVFVVELE